MPIRRIDLNDGRILCLDLVENVPKKLITLMPSLPPTESRGLNFPQPTRTLSHRDEISELAIFFNLSLEDKEELIEAIDEILGS